MSTLCIGRDLANSIETNNNVNKFEKHNIGLFNVYKDINLVDRWAGRGMAEGHAIAHLSV